ncbi:TetR/AcrR family transcriptional regulator [Novosphingobium umbonatum]|uniref:TetR/AcrR family transcriptional regulator n=1 Tax=Novosphingobium umbonatum TaxID=1908524 RepID=UPI001FE576D8|nr:TetR/AcrR family transcriptional regulator [Novosphingobium umbonatum]
MKAKVADIQGELSKRQITALRTREDILDVATQEFSEKGLAGARIDEIAEKTHTSKRMIYYHFGSKDELYRAVLERAYSRIRDGEQAAHFEDMPPEQALRAIIGHNFDYHFDHPEFVRLVMSENVNKGEHITQIPGMRERNRTVIEALGAILRKGVEQGVFRDGIDPIDLHMTISALSFYNVSNRYTFLQNFGVDFSTPVSRARRRVQIIDCVMGWVRKD